jgi:membrane protease YdiL (CAAX protease family)
MTRGRIAFTSSLLAIVAGAGLAVFMVPVLLANEDSDALPALFVPLVLALVAFAGLSAKCTSGSLFGERSAIVSLALLVVFTVLTGFSIGILVLPVAALVALAVASTPPPAGR